MAQAVEYSDINPIMGIGSMVGETFRNNKGYLMGIIPAFALVGLPHHAAQESQSGILNYLSDLKLEIGGAVLMGLIWGNDQHTKAHGMRHQFLKLEESRNEADADYPGAFTIIEHSKPKDQAEADKLKKSIEAIVAKVIPQATPKQLEDEAGQVIGLYHAKANIEKNIEMSGGPRMWAEVAKEAAQAGIWSFSLIALTNLCLTYFYPMMTQPNVSFSLNNTESFALGTRIVSQALLWSLGLREVLNSKFKNAEFFAAGIQVKAKARAKKNGAAGAH